MDAARLRPIAVLEVADAGARHLEDRPLEGADRVGHGDLGGRSGQPVAAGLAAGRGHQPGPAQVADELLEVGVRQLLAPRDLGEREAAVLALGARQRDEDADAVLGAGADLHRSSSLTRTSSPTTSVG